MKQGKLARTANVTGAEECLAYLKARPVLEMVGLGLIYGKPGLGKTTFALRTAAQNGYLYLRLEATTTAKSFAIEFLGKLRGKYGDGKGIVKGSANGIYQSCKSILDRHPNTVIFVDEIDYAFANPVLLGALRDIVDETLTIVVLVGMDDAEIRLQQINQYYFDRCNYFYQFKPFNESDMKLICGEIMDVRVNDEIVKWLVRTTNGNLRQAVKLLHSAEETAAVMGKDCLSLDDLGV